MVEQKLEIHSAETEKEERLDPVANIEGEIECPRCHESMLLCSDFDRLFYSCEWCDFCLYTIKH